MKIVTILGSPRKKGFTEYLQLTKKGSYILPFCTTPDAISDNGDEIAKSLADAITE